MSGNVLDFYILREFPIQISFVIGDNLCKQFGPRSGLTVGGSVLKMNTVLPNPSICVTCARTIKQ